MNQADLLQAMYTRLNAVAAVTSLATGGIHSKHPQDDDAGLGSAFPYITLGPITASPFNTKTGNGVNALFQVHVWSRSESHLERLGIVDAVYDALQNHALSITGADTVLCQMQSTNEIPDPDGITTHSIMVFRVVYYDI
jgi:hypothetical protein